MLMASLLIDLIKAVGAVIAVGALIFIFPFVLLWFFRRVSLGTPEEDVSTIRKIR